MNHISCRYYYQAIMAILCVLLLSGCNPYKALKNTSASMFPEKQIQQQNFVNPRKRRPSGNPPILPYQGQQQQQQQFPYQQQMMPGQSPYGNTIPPYLQQQNQNQQQYPSQDPFQLMDGMPESSLPQPYQQHAPGQHSGLEARFEPMGYDTQKKHPRCFPLSNMHHSPMHRPHK